MPIHALLHEIFPKASKDSLWCVDESSANLLDMPFAGSIVTNRIDLQQQLQKAGRTAIFNDFDFSEFADNSIDKVFYRIAKDKKLNIHIIHSLARKLKDDGIIFLLGFKNEGIESLHKLIEMNTDAKSLRQKLKKQLQLIEMGKARHQSMANDYSLLHRLDEQQKVYWSKPGIFGWDKTDVGSAILMQEFSQQNHAKDARILDLGCGYGYLSLQAFQHGFTRIDATDNNAAAINACTANFGLYGIEGEVIADDCAANINKRYDIILCNPPFHQGFDHSKPLTERFCQAASRLLAPSGKVYFVVNQFIGIEKAAKGLFSQHQLLGQQHGFKVLCFVK